MTKPQEKQDRLVQNLINIGPKMAGYLKEIGIEWESELREMGVMTSFQKIATIHPHAYHRMALYALYGALTDQNCTDLPQETKDWLEEQLAEAEKA